MTFIEIVTVTDYTQVTFIEIATVTDYIPFKMANRGHPECNMCYQLFHVFTELFIVTR